MKSIPSSIFYKEQPLEKGMDVALLFALENHNAITEHYAKLQKSLLSVKKQEEEIKNNKYLILPSIVCLVGIILAFVVSYFLLVVLLAGAIWLYFSYKTNNEKLDGLKADRDRLVKELNAKMPQLVKKIGTVNYCAEILPFGDGSLITDVSEIIDNSSINCSLIENCENKLTELMDRRSKLNKDFPVLLPPGQESVFSDTIYLTGIEKDVEDILNLLDELITDCSVININLPIYEKDDKIPTIIKDLEPKFRDVSNDLISVMTSRDRSTFTDKLRMTNSEVEIVKSFGYQKIEMLIRSVYKEMDDLSFSLTDNRNYSINDVLLKSVEEIEDIYDFPLTRFYNPKLSGSKLLENSIRKYDGNDFDKIEVAEFESFYKKDDMIKLRDIQAKVKGILKNMPENEKITNSELNSYLQKRYDKYADLIKDMSLEIAPDEEEENSKHYKNAILFYNTFKKKWICQLTGEEFTDVEALKSRILKIKEDLINPIWDKLWLEKHDEKVRIIREKELELRENKKQENSELREEVKIFTEELRPIRNRLEESAVKARVGEQKLKLSMDFYTSQDILNSSTISRMKSYLASDEVKVETVFQEADTMEANLEKEPESVMLVRGDLKDYTLQVRNKEKFYLTQK
jgi:hypothetical protein